MLAAAILTFPPLAGAAPAAQATEQPDTPSLTLAAGTAPADLIPGGRGRATLDDAQDSLRPPSSALDPLQQLTDQDPMLPATSVPYDHFELPVAPGQLAHVQVSGLATTRMVLDRFGNVMHVSMGTDILRFRAVAGQTLLVVGARPNIFGSYELSVLGLPDVPGSLTVHPEGGDNFRASWTAGAFTPYSNSSPMPVVYTLELPGSYLQPIHTEDLQARFQTSHESFRVTVVASWMAIGYTSERAIAIFEPGPQAPGQVRNLRVEPGRYSVTVRWDVPESLGTGGTTGTIQYLVEVGDTRKWVIGPATSVAMPAYPGTHVTASVTPHVAFRAGPAASVTAFYFGTADTEPTAWGSPGYRGLLAEWSFPSSIYGKSREHQMRVVASPGGSSCTATNDFVGSCFIPGLRNGTKYQLTLYVTTSVGTATVPAKQFATPTHRGAIEVGADRGGVPDGPQVAATVTPFLATGNYTVHLQRKSGRRWTTVNRNLRTAKSFELLSTRITKSGTYRFHLPKQRGVTPATSASFRVR